MRTLLTVSAALLAALIISACASLPAPIPPAPTATLETAATVTPDAVPAPDATEAAPATPPAATAATPADIVTPAPTMPPAATETQASIDCIPGALTPAQTEGPYYKANPPETASLFQPGMSGTRILLTGYVLDEQCRPIPGARVDFWQADAAGRYDNAGFTLRGYQLTDDAGRYAMQTVVPGEYPGRTPHVHVKVTPPGGGELTSQLYLPDAAANATDRIFSPELIVNLSEGPDGMVGMFNFVVRTK